MVRRRERLLPPPALLHHAVWLATAVASAAAAATYAGDLDDSPAIAYALGGIATTFGALTTALWLLGSGRRPRIIRPHPRSARARAAARHPQRARLARLRPPWRQPAVWAYVAGAPLGVFSAAALATGDTGVAASVTAMWAFALLLGFLIGVATSLLLLAVGICLWGVVMFGRPLLTGRIDGEPVPRASFAGPFVAVAGLLLLPVALAGPLAYDSPWRRDIWPMFGVVRDGVEVTHPMLLLAAQVATWTCFGGLGVGYLLFRLSGRPARPGG